MQTEEFREFFDSLGSRSQTKLLYALNIVATIKVVSTKLVKRLAGTDFYELRISTDNEYRVIIFSIDKENLIEASEIMLLNGFLKKSTKDYEREIKIAKDILRRYETDD